VLMDMRMPVMDGYEATRRIKALSPRTPVVAVTASALEDDRQSILDCGVDAFLSKPVDRAQLKQTLWQLLRLASVDTAQGLVAEAPPELTRARVWAQLPADLRARLQEVLAQGDILAFEQRLLAAPDADPAVVRGLLHLAHEFELDQLHSLLTQPA
jgi:CheY-like chemotaxis protein